MAITPRGKREPDRRQQVGPMLVNMWKIGTDRDGKDLIAYQLYDSDWHDNPVFEGNDFHSPNGYSMEESALSLLGFLTLKEGDTDSEYFEQYTPEQIKWRDERAEQMQIEVMEAEEKLAARRKVKPSLRS